MMNGEKNKNELGTKLLAVMVVVVRELSALHFQYISFDGRQSTCGTAAQINYRVI